MNKAQEAFEIANNSMKRVARLLTRLDIQNAKEISFEGKTSTLMAAANINSCPFTVALRTSNRVLMAISSAMKRSIPLDENEMHEYALEFFNILCGNILSTVNDTFHISMNFAIPTRIDGEYKDQSVPNRAKKELFYESGYGPIALQLFYDPHLFDMDKKPENEKGDLHMNKKVLVVDDSIFIYNEMVLLLETSGFEICAYAKSGEEALELYEKHRPDVVTMDIILPGMDGIETTKKIIEKWPEAKVIMVSSLAYRKTLEETAALGAIDFIFKPFDKARLLSALLSAIDN